MTDLDKLDALAAAATPGPWSHRPNHKPYHVVVFGGKKAYEAGLTTSDIEKADAAFIVALVNAYPELAAAVEERDRLRAALLHSAEEAHIYGPDHDRRPIFECSYEPCRKARAALHHEAGAS